MGESQNQPFQLSFNRFLLVAFQGSRVTSSGGLILVRELDERFGLSRLIGEHLLDSRTGSIPCFCSTVRETTWRRSCDRAMCTVLTAGKSCYCRRLSASKRTWKCGFSGRRGLCQARDGPGPGRRWGEVYDPHSSGQPDDNAAGGGEGRVSRRGALSPWASSSLIWSCRAERSYASTTSGVQRNIWIKEGKLAVN